MTMIPARLTAACLAALLLAACGGGGGGTSAGGGTATDGTTGGGATGGNATGANGTGGDDGAAATLDGADLSHAGQPLPRQAVDPATLPLVSPAGRARAAELPGPLGVLYEVTENHGGDSDVDCRAVGAEYGSCSIANLHVKDAAGTLNDGGWQLYFHSLRRILRVDSDEFAVFRVNGDLHYLEPAAGFAGFDGDGAARVKTIRLVTEFSQLIESDFLPRYWLVRDGGAPELIANTDEDSDPRAYAMPITGENRRAYNGEPIPLATPATRFAANAEASGSARTLDARSVQARIVPTPREIDVGTGNLDVSRGFSFAGSALSAASIAALEARQTTLGIPRAANVALDAALDVGLAPATHTLDVTAGGIRIRGHDEEALFHGAQSLLALVQLGVPTIPTVRIEDDPRFVHRGMHVDVARNFQSVASIRRLLDQMGAYKLNRLHLHLADDEGWRLEIPGLPELTDVGARRAFALDANGDVTEAAGLMPQLGSGPFDTNRGSGHFTRAEFIALLRYAAARHVQVIPEFDMPGHARAAVVAMRARAANLGTPTDPNVRIDDPDDTSRYVTTQHYDDGILNPCLPGTYAFLESVIGEVRAMYAEAGAPLEIWHMGGDEARNIQLGAGYPNPDTSRWDLPWERSPACTAYIAATAGVDSRDDLERHFVERVSRLVADAGIPRLYAWHEIVGDADAGTLATAGAGVTFWRPVSGGQTVVEAARGFVERGFETVLSAPDFLYFDFPQEVDPEERGQYWATRYSDTRKVFGFAPENLPQNAETTRDRNGRPWTGAGAGAYPDFQGIQGHLWSELTRTDEQFDFMVYPRLLALAERAWHRADWELDYDPGASYSMDTNLVDKTALATDYARFAATLGQKELAKLDAAGVRYRIPVPGASTASGALDMNVALPGLPLEYSADGRSFVPWSPGAASTATVVRARSADGTRAGRADRIE